MNSFKCITVLALVGLCCGCLAPTKTVTPSVQKSSTQKAPATGVVASVGDKTLTEAEVQQLVKRQITLAKKMQVEMPEDTDSRSAFTAMVEEAIVERFISTQLTQAIAQAHAISVSEDELAQAKQQIEAAHGGSFEAAAATAMMDPKVMEQLLRESLLAQKVLEQLVARKVTLSEEEFNTAFTAWEQTVQSMTKQMEETRAALEAGTTTFDDLVKTRAYEATTVTLTKAQLARSFPPAVVATIAATPEKALTEVIADSSAGVIAIIRVLERTAPAPTAENIEGEETVKLQLLAKQLPMGSADREVFRKMLIERKTNLAIPAFLAEQVKQHRVTAPRHPELLRKLLRTPLQ